MKLSAFEPFVTIVQSKVPLLQAELPGLVGDERGTLTGSREHVATEKSGAARLLCLYSDLNENSIFYTMLCNIY